jgi:hypothetical protein
MLNPAGLRVELLVFSLGGTNDLPRMIEQDAARAGSPLVNGSNVVIHNWPGLLTKSFLKTGN